MKRTILLKEELNKRKVRINYKKIVKRKHNANGKKMLMEIEKENCVCMRWLEYP